MKEKAAKPSAAEIKQAVRRLRRRIESSDDPVIRRLSQAMEEGIRWATEATDWPPPDGGYSRAGEMVKARNRRGRIFGVSARHRELQAIADGDAPEQLELSPIFQEVRERYADCVRLVAIELSRAQVDALANMARAHQAGDFFYSRAQEGFEVLEIIVRSWCGRTAERHRSAEKVSRIVPQKPEQARSVTDRLKEVEQLILHGSKATPATAGRIAHVLGISRKQFYRDVAFLRQTKKEIVYDARASTYCMRRPMEQAKGVSTPQHGKRMAV